MTDALWFLTLALWGAGFFLLPRLRRCGGGHLPDDPPAVSVIVPARNEAHNLPALLRSLAAQCVKPGEIIVVDDASTDRTAEVARESGAVVLPAQPVPEGWRGKTWACHQGAQAARGELWLFVDADTWFEPGGLARILAAYARAVPVKEDRPLPRSGAAGAGDPAEGRVDAPVGRAFSVGPYHAVRRAYEDLSLFFNFNMTVGTVPAGLFGQMLLVDRESYRRVGGHEAVKGRTLENCFLAQRFRAAGVATRSATGRGVLAFRMYPGGVRELVAGWTKGFASGAGQTPRGVLALVVAWLMGLMLAPLGWAVTGEGWRWGAAYLAAAAQVGWLARQIGGFRWLTALGYPVPLVFFLVVFARSARRAGRQVTWKGRDIRAD